MVLDAGFRTTPARSRLLHRVQQTKTKEGHKMDWLGIVVAGLVGTVVITVFMYSGPMMGMPKMDIAQMIGSMILPRGTAAFVMGMMMHFAAGIVFAIIYGFVWNGLDTDPSWWTGLIFGSVHTAVAAMVMGMMAKIHKEIKAGNLPSPMAAGAKGMMGLLMGHLAYGLVVALMYSAYI